MRPKGQRLCRRPLGCHSGHLSAREQRPPFQRLAPCAGRQHAEHPVLNAAQQQGFEALRQGMAPSANQQAELHSLWEKVPGYVPAHRGAGCTSCGTRRPCRGAQSPCGAAAFHNCRQGAQARRPGVAGGGPAARMRAGTHSRRGAALAARFPAQKKEE